MSRLLRILQVEDDESDAAMVVRHMEQAGYSVQSLRVQDAEEMRQAIAEQAWDVVIADYHLPRFDAPGALRILLDAGLDTPFVVVSGVLGDDLGVQMMKAGAHDYLSKSDLGRLAAAVEREVREARGRHDRRTLAAHRRNSNPQWREPPLRTKGPRLPGSAASSDPRSHA